MSRPADLNRWFDLFEGPLEDRLASQLDYAMYAYITWLEGKLERIEAILNEGESNETD